ncbi:hypothetical protein [Streptomyces sp. NPDC051016]|uniref:hypothetical protein n=1 Tax=Streptomyces sp. NPDC051016 TaxID=3365638 RepID=UPI003787C33B
MKGYDPLYDPAKDPGVPVLSADGQRRLARGLLDELAALNIHDHSQMVRAAASLDFRMRCLLASLDAELGEIR